MISVRREGRTMSPFGSDNKDIDGMENEGDGWTQFTVWVENELYFGTPSHRMLGPDGRTLIVKRETLASLAMLPEPMSEPLKPHDLVQRTTEDFDRYWYVLGIDGDEVWIRCAEGFRTTENRSRLVKVGYTTTQTQENGNE